jgi:HAD superfamily hydrolase (TIGR01509 family)
MSSIADIIACAIADILERARRTKVATRPVIFLDDGGVMNDNHLRGPQWQRLIGEFFAPRLGGTRTAWAEANRITVTRMFEPENWQARILAASDYASFERDYWLDWVGGMCQFAGVALPSVDESLKLAQQAEAYIAPLVRSAFPGAIEAIRELHAQGYLLHTASGEPSTTLHDYLEGMGVRTCFERLYGPDLLDTLKAKPEYYERLFVDAQISPGDALIVDDSPRVLAWAKELGAMTVLVGADAERGTLDGTRHIGSLAELPELMRQFEHTH